MLRRIKQFYEFAIKPKKIWSLPAKSDILIYDSVGSEILKKLFDQQKISILYVRNECINIFSLLGSLFSLKFWQGKIRNAYIDKFIKFVNPRIVITFIDTDINFYSIKKPNENTIFIFTQNGTRSYYGDLFELLNNYKTNDKFNVDFLGVFGKNIQKKYGKFVKGKSLTLGSLKNNHYIVKTDFNKDSIGYISQFNVKDLKGRVVNGKLFSHMDFWKKIDIQILTFLKKYCKKNKKKLFIIPRFSDSNALNDRAYFKSILGTDSDKNLLLEREYFKSILNEDPIFSDKISEGSGYLAVDSAEVVVGVDDTLVYESAARGNKTAFFSFRGSSLNIKGLDFGWPGKYSVEGKFWSNNADSKVFKKILDYLFSISKNEYELEKERIGFSNILNFDPGNKILKSVIK